MKTLKELFAVFGFAVATVVGTSFDWSLGVAVIGLMVLTGTWSMLFKAERKTEHRINIRYAPSEPRNIERDNARFALRMEEKICENGEF